MFGGYISVAYDILSLFETDQYLAPFFRYERYDTQQGLPGSQNGVAGAFTENGAEDVVEYTFGLTYKPHPQVVLKADVQNQNNKAGTGVDTFTLGLGYMY